MKCDRCSELIAPGDERDHFGQNLCEDCYIDAISPIKTCDPWAVHSAKNFEKHSGDERMLTSLQSEMLRILKEDGPMEPTALLEKIGGDIGLKDLEREFATLRHMEKARGEKQDQKVFWRLW